MGIFAWIVLGLIVGYIATQTVARNGKDTTQNFIRICLIGAGGGLLGGLVAVWLFNVGSIGAFFSLAGWMSAVVGSVLALLLYNMLNSAHVRS